MSPFNKISVMGVGFVGGRYCELYPHEAVPESRETLIPIQSDVLFLRSTVHNYWPKQGDLHRDIDTNLSHLVDVLPNVRGVFNQVSSWFCYGAAAGIDISSPARESDPCDPNGWYGITKLASEKLIRSYSQMEGKSYRLLRLCSVIGNDPKAGKQKGAIDMLIGKIVRGEDVDLYDGEGYRNVLHVDDVCRAIHLCLTKGELDTCYNVGNMASVRVYDLLQHALSITGSKSRINLVAPPRFHQVVQTDSYWMDTSRLRALGFTPDMDAYQAVERVIARMIQ